MTAAASSLAANPTNRKKAKMMQGQPAMRPADDVGFAGT
jgi:hypothetical protein